MTICYLYEASNAAMSDWVLLGRYTTIETGKKAAMKKIGERPYKRVAILRNVTLRHTDILYLVEYQKGSLYWKDKKKAKDHTGYVFQGFGKRRQQFIKTN